jgi:hypothetical protein
VTDKPVNDDIRFDDQDYNPTIAPNESKAWLNLLQESEDAFEDYNHHCDLIDRQYAHLARLASNSREKEFSMFWANMEVIKPSIYAKTPVPVVVPKFLDRRPVYQAASEMAERCAVVAFDLTEINELMKLVRDDLALIDRGIAWCRYESGDGPGDYYPYEKVCVDFKNRKDFLHSISRNWREVTWVAGASYLTRQEARKRFYKYSGDAYQDADYKVDRDAKEVGGADARERAKFWEVWDKKNRRVLWVSEGAEDILDEDDPHLHLRNFFPCPKPAYGTCQRGSLVPVPDVLQYKDQLEEINLLTGRIHALSDAVEVKGFYPAGGGEVAEAINTAISIKSPGRVMVPISNWAAFGGTKDVIIWLPIEQIAQTITQLVALRKEIINDIYQIIGLSDIMRGSTNPMETLGAQQLKSQYGSTRIKDKQQELVRLARDLVEITIEIIFEKFSDKTMIEMSQTELPTNQQIDLQIQQIMTQAMQAARSPQAQQMMQQQPDQMQAIQQQVQSQIDKLKNQPTIDQVMRLIKDYRARAFTFDIETDSTIQADEQAEKQQRNEFTGVLSQLLPQLMQMVTAEPKSIELAGQILKFATAPYRAGRVMEGSIDGFVELGKAKADEPKGDDPTTAQNKVALQIETMKLKQQAETDKGKLALQDKELQMKDRQHSATLENQRRIEMAKLQASQQDDEAKANLQNQKSMHEQEKHQVKMVETAVNLQAAQQKAELAERQQQMRANDMAARQNERQQAAAFKQQTAAASKGIMP